jgi:hypothetical protein
VTPGTFRLNAVTQRKHLSSPHVSLPRCNSGPAFAPVFDVGETRVLFISLPFPSLLLRSFLCLPFRFRGFRRANRIVVYPHVRPAVCRHGTTRFAHDRFLLNFVFLDICYMFVDTLPVWWKLDKITDTLHEHLRTCSFVQFVFVIETDWGRRNNCRFKQLAVYEISTRHTIPVSLRNKWQTPYTVACKISGRNNEESERLMIYLAIETYRSSRRGGGGGGLKQGRVLAGI